MEILTRKELAERLKISIGTIISWEDDGMPVIRNNQIVRYDWEAVQKWLQPEV